MDIFLSLTGDGVYWNGDQGDQIDGIYDLDKFFNRSLIDLDPDVAEIYKHKFREFTDKLYSIAPNEYEEECWRCKHCEVPNYHNDGMADCKLLDKIIMECDTCDEWTEKKEEED